MDKFLQRKKSILNKKDKSFIGSWDKKIIKLCKKINSLENYYTTSSCSGRIVLIKDNEKKEKNLFLFISHNKTSIKEIKKNEFLLNNEIKFKQEPPILHIACKTIEDAKKMLNKALNSGFKRSGIIALEKNIILEINGTDKIELPIISKKKWLIDDNFLKIILKKSNKNLKKGWKKINNLYSLI